MRLDPAGRLLFALFAWPLLVIQENRMTQPTDLSSKSKSALPSASESALRSTRGSDTALLVAAVLTLAAWGYGLFGVGTDRDQGDVYRILFVHVPVAWCAFVWVIAGAVFAVRLFFSPARAQGLDRSSQACVELGTLFAALALLTGSIWGRPTWGRWWDWDPRLTSTLVMFLVTCGYHILRSFTPDVRARRTVAAVVALLGALNVPIVYFSVNLWRSLHQPQSIVANQSNMSGDIKLALWVNVFALLALSIALYRVRRQSIAAKETLEMLRAEQGLA